MVEGEAGLGVVVEPLDPSTHWALGVASDHHRPSSRVVRPGGGVWQRVDLVPGARELPWFEVREELKGDACREDPGYVRVIRK